jgi:hypothetical protein
VSDFHAPSTLEAHAGQGMLSLATALGATPTGLVDHPAFFTGMLARPDVAAAGMLAVADVAVARYADAGLGKRLANLDPLVTASGDRLRFESFSACNGVYARFDLLGDGVEGGEIGFGTTNVDINQPLRNALARVGRTDLLHLQVGDDALAASSLDETHVEEKVRLPDCWVRGCAEVPSIAARMEPALALHGPAIPRLLGLLPSGMPPGPTLYLLTVGAVVRATPQRLPGSIPVTGTARLGAAARIARHATTLTVHVGPHATSAWVFEVPGGRLTLLLSPGPYRGFSGEGGLLTLLAEPAAELAGGRLLAHLGWAPAIDADRLARATGLSAAEIEAGLAWLTACGRVGYDLTEQTYFHRDLPVDAAQVLRRSPRLVQARRLVERGAVTADGRGWIVQGAHDRYRVLDDRCSCRWEIEHQGSRGPCKHVLAVALASAPSGSTADAPTRPLP